MFKVHRQLYTSFLLEYVYLLFTYWSVYLYRLTVMSLEYTSSSWESHGFFQGVHPTFLYDGPFKQFVANPQLLFIILRNLKY